MAIVMCGNGSCTTEIKNTGKPCPSPVLTYEGAVLETYEQNGYDDSDFVAIVWDGDKIVHREYASTRGWTYHNGAKVDATDDVRAAALAWYRARLAPYLIKQAREDSIKVRHGKTVRSLTTRGKNKGVQGVVKWIGAGYGYHDVDRVGIKIEGEDKLRYLPIDRVDVIDPDPVNEDEIKKYATTAVPHSWHLAF